MIGRFTKRAAGVVAAAALLNAGVAEYSTLTAGGAREGRPVAVSRACPQFLGSASIRSSTTSALFF